MSRSPTIAVVDDHRLFSSGFSLVLAAPPINGEVSVFDMPRELLAPEARPRRWDLIILDMFIPGHDVRDAIRAARRRWPDATVIVVSGSRSPGDEAICLDAGAAAFLSKTIDPEQLKARICALLGIDDGRDGAEPTSQQDVIAATAAAGGLSARQMEIVLLAAEGLSNKEIALALGVSPETVKTHMATAFQRLGARNRTAAIEAARRLGLL